MAQVGRISGAVLLDNLERNGNDLAFRNDSQTTQLLYLDVANQYLGINTDSPSDSLTVNDSINSVDAIATTADIANYEISGDELLLNTGNIKLDSNSVVRLGNARTDDLLISNGKIKTRASSSKNLSVEPQGNTAVNNNLHVVGSIYTPGDITLGGNIVFGDADTDTINFNSELTSNLIPNNSNNTLGSNQKRWKAIIAQDAFVPSVTVANLYTELPITTDYLDSQNSVFQNVSLNSLVQSDFAPHTDDTYNLGTETLYYNFATAQNFRTGGLEIVDNNIQTTTTNLVFKGTNNSSVKVFNNVFAENTIGNENSVTEFYSSGDFVLDTTQSALVPKGNSQSSNSLPSLRYNTDLDIFEGEKNYRYSFRGVYSDDRKSFVSAHPIDNTLSAFIDNTQKLSVNSDNFTTMGATAGNVYIKNAVISNAAQNLNLVSDTTRVTAFDDIFFQGCGIDTTSQGSVIEFKSIDAGTYKISSNRGTVFPSGTETQKPSTSQTGNTRFNTTNDILEVWDGSTWIDASGASDFYTQSEFDDLITEYTLMFA